MRSKEDMLRIGANTRFGNGQDPRKGGRKPNILKDLHKILNEDGEIRFEASEIKKRNEDGSIIVKVPTTTQIAMKIVRWAMSNKGGESTRMLALIVDKMQNSPNINIGIASESAVNVIFTDNSKKNE